VQVRLRLGQYLCFDAYMVTCGRGVPLLHARRRRICPRRASSSSLAAHAGVSDRPVSRFYTQEPSAPRATIERSLSAHSGRVRPKGISLQNLADKLNSDILYTEEVADLSRKSVATIRWLKATGQGPKCGKLGRRVVYRRKDVEAWINSAFKDGAA
jgi:predicted DNA-binding transcriptional regulator AlpA